MSARRRLIPILAVVVLWAAVVLGADRLLADRDWAPIAVFGGLWLTAVLVYGLAFNPRGAFGRDIVVVLALAVVAGGIAAGWAALHPMSPVLVAPG
jgi:hypothetical protein